MARVEEEYPAVVNNYADDNNDGEEDLAVVPDVGTLAWSGYLLIALSVLADWAGLIDGQAGAFTAYVLLLFGCGFLCLAMLAPAKLKAI